jgi:hypothetical protein
VPNPGSLEELNTEVSAQCDYLKGFQKEKFGATLKLGDG